MVAASNAGDVSSGPLRSRWRRVVWVAVGLVIVISAVAAWYRIHYSMDPARAFEVAGAGQGPRVLIATQGSEFKDAVVAGVVDHLKAREAHVKVIDIGVLPGARVSDWDAIVVIHTWEMRRPPEPVKAFIEQAGHSPKVIVLTTSGAGDFKLEGVDAISAASRVADVPERVAEISRRIDTVLAAPVGR